jgi:hypothetical protein
VRGEAELCTGNIIGTQSYYSINSSSNTLLLSYMCMYKITLLLLLLFVKYNNYYTIYHLGWTRWSDWLIRQVSLPIQFLSLKQRENISLNESKRQKPALLACPSTLQMEQNIHCIFWSTRCFSALQAMHIRHWYNKYYVGKLMGCTAIPTTLCTPWALNYVVTSPNPHPVLAALHY